MLRRAAIALLVIAAGACVHYTGSARDFDAARLDRQPGWVAARGVPVVRQRSADDCGPAVLASMLRYWDRPVSLAEAWSLAPPRSGRGVRAGRLRDALRQRGLRAFLVAGTVTDLRRELAGRRPVIVGLVEPHSNRRGFAHYEIVLGWNADRRRVVTVDPARGLRVRPVDGFIAEWKPSGRVALVVLGPRRMPAARADGGASTSIH